VNGEGEVVKAIHGVAEVAAILLILELLLLTIAVGVMVYFARRALSIGRENLELWLGTVREYAQQVEQATAKVSRTIISAQISVISEVRGLRRAAELLFREINSSR